MQDLLKRYPWAIAAVVVAICVVFAATATSHLIEGKYLSDSEHSPKVVPMIPSSSQLFKPQRTKDGSAFAARNMFCSECSPPVQVANSDPSSILTTSLPLLLLATNVGTGDDGSYATIINTESQQQGSFAVGHRIPGATGSLKEIHYKYIDFENNGRLERLVLAGATAPVAPPPPVATTETPAGEGSGDELQTAIDNGVKKINDTTYEIDRALVDRVLANPMGIAKGARLVPAIKNGKSDGFKLYAIRPNSVYSKLGLQNGDTLQSINNFEMTSLNQALEIYSKLRDASSLEVDILRRGKPEKLKYSIR